MVRKYVFPLYRGAGDIFLRLLIKNRQTLSCVYAEGPLCLSKRESHLVETGSSGCCRSAALLHCPIPEDRVHSRILSAGLRRRGKVSGKQGFTSVPLAFNKC